MTSERGPLARPRVPFFGARRLRWRDLRLRDALMLSAIPWLILIYVLGGSLLAYLESRQADDWFSRGVHLDELFHRRAGALLRVPSAMAVRLRLDPASPDPAVLRLRVDRGTWADWQADPLALWGEWIDAELVRGNTFHAAKLRKRGDTSVHWLREKRSFTLRTRKNDLYRGYRELAFSAKTPVAQWVTQRLAGEFGLISGTTALAPVYVNDRFAGLYRLIEPPDESLLRREGWLPGNIFRGDTAERGEVYKGVARDLFVNPYIWDRTASNDRPSAPAESALFRFIAAVNGTTFADHQALMAQVDRDEIGRMFAYLELTGDLYHMSPVHNQLWYEDPSSALLHPIVWDIRPLSLENPPDDPLNAAFQALLRDPFVLDRATGELVGRMAAGDVLETSRTALERAMVRFADPLAYEELRRGLIPPIRGDEVLETLAGNAAVLERRLADAGVAFHGALPDADGALVLDFDARGHAAAELRALELRGAGEAAPRLRADRNRNGRLDPTDPELATRWTPGGAGGTLRLVEPLRLLPGVSADEKRIRPGPIHYRLFLEAPGTRAVRPELVHGWTGAVVEPVAWEAGEVILPGASWHPWRYPEPSGREIRLAGERQLSETLVVETDETLVIEPGTTLRLDPDVSILARGRVVARGEPDRPISLVPAAARRPWGSFALQGRGSDGSVIEHVRFAGGGGAVLQGVEYKGMVSVHRARDVHFRACEFADNLRSDDALNAVSADVSIRDSRFLRTNADAIDFDLSSGEICGSTFEQSGNDAIDLMTSSVRIAGNQIAGSGDKGVSIGEASSPLLFGNRIESCRIGVEIKDRSEPFLVRNRVVGNRVGVLEQRKNWRYGAGGWGKLIDNTFRDNGEDVHVGPRSRLTRASANGAGELPDWLRAQWGIARGPEGEWLVARTGMAPLAAATFRDDLESRADGWLPSGGVARLEKRDQSLVMGLRREGGAIERRVDWNLSAPGSYVAVFELSAAGLREAQLSLSSDAGERSFPIDLSGPPDGARFVEIDLEPARYHAVRLAAVPESNTARLELHALGVWRLDLESELAASAAACSVSLEGS